MIGAHNMWRFPAKLWDRNKKLLNLLKIFIKILKNIKKTLKRILPKILIFKNMKNITR